MATAKGGNARGAAVDGRGLPVDPERLRKEFPALTDDDLAAYGAVTRGVLALAPEARGERIREILDKARAARARQEMGAAVSDADQRLVRYLAAMEKMQGPAGRPSH